MFMVTRGIVDFCAIFGHKTSFRDDHLFWYTLSSFHELALQPMLNGTGRN